MKSIDSELLDALYDCIIPPSLRLIGFSDAENRAPQPSGYPIDRGDLSLLEAVKKRCPI